MKKTISVIVVLFMLVIAGCTNNSAMNIQYWDVKEIQSIPLLEWIDNNKANGLYLSHNKTESTIYLYVNYSTDDTYGAGSVSIRFNNINKAVVINTVKKIDSNTNSKLPEEAYEKLFTIDYGNKKVKKVNLNDKDFKLSDIMEIY